MLNAAHLRRDTEARVVVGCAGAAKTTLAAAIAVSSRPELASAEVVRLRSPAEARKWLASLP